MNDTQQPDPQVHSFCQICGRAVASEADRLAGRAFPCGLCNEVKLASPASTGYVYPGAETGSGQGAVGGGGGAIPPVPPPVGYSTGDVPNPGLAALLGLIPGVGAMYNGQYAKGIVHLIVFAVLSSLVDSNGVFLLFVFGWVAYQSIEAHHTARARRDGLPLPNPFGLNDIGERLGFGKAWPNYPSTANPGSADAGAPGPDPNATTGAPFTQPPAGGAYQPPASNWGAPADSYRDSYRYQAPPVAPFGAPPMPPYGTQPIPPYGVPPVPPYPPYAPVGTGFDENGLPFDPARAGMEPPYLAPRNRFPAGAIWLIALGTLFLLNTSGIFHGFSFRLSLPLMFVGLGVWAFLHRMVRSGLGMADDGTPGYRLRLFRAARGAVWLILIGVIFFLADFNILPWSRSWPLFLILAGVMAFLERAVYSGASQQQAYGYAPPTAPGYYPPPPATPGTEIVTADPAITTQSREGR